MMTHDLFVVANLLIQLQHAFVLIFGLSLEFSLDQSYVQRSDLRPK